MTISTTRLRRTALVGLLTSSALISAQAAMASDTFETQANQSLSIEQASQYLHYSGGNDRFSVQVAPNYSEELGFRLKRAPLRGT